MEFRYHTADLIQAKICDLFVELALNGWRCHPIKQMEALTGALIGDKRLDVGDKRLGTQIHGYRLSVEGTTMSFQFTMMF